MPVHCCCSKLVPPLFQLRPDEAIKFTRQLFVPLEFRGVGGTRQFLISFRMGLVPEAHKAAFLSLMTSGGGKRTV
jgi:hypothetical protein